MYPPVDTVFYHPDAVSPGSHFLDRVGAGAVQARGSRDRRLRARGRRCASSGNGPERARLEREAGSNVEFLGRLTDEEIRDEYRRARP